jgi:hypothetical protein
VEDKHFCLFLPMICSSVYLLFFMSAILHGLTDFSTFNWYGWTGAGQSRLPTQRAMRAYAIEEFPDLETLDEGDLKLEIQNLKARIDAKGLRRK